MNILNVLEKSIDLNRMVLDAIELIKEKLDSDSELGDLLNNTKEAVKSIDSNSSVVLNDKNRQVMNRSSQALLEACTELEKSRLDCESFIHRSKAWKSVSELCLYSEAIHATLLCGEEEEGLAIRLMSRIIADPVSLELKAAAGFALSRKLSFSQPLEAYQLCLNAFEVDNRLCEKLYLPSHPAHKYVYRKVKEVYFENCPSCHGAGTPYFCSLPININTYTPAFSPVKLWMRCKTCGQLFTYNFPKSFLTPQKDSKNQIDRIIKPKVALLPIFGTILNSIKKHTQGIRLLEVGAGGGELIAAALELGFEVDALEIMEKQAELLSKMLSVQVCAMDFLDYNTPKKYDIITMGDVVEHVTDPVAAIQKAHSLLEDSGILWVSTPNFESGFSRIMKFNDPMWSEPCHISYFSRGGFQKLLHENGFRLLDYKISNRYNGSMELIAEKVS